MTVPAAQMDNIKAEAITIEERSPFQVVMMRFVKHRLAMVAMALFFILSVLTVIATLLRDILYTIVDPRIRLH